MPALGAGGGQGGIGGDPGAIEAAADQVRGGAATSGAAGASVAGRGDAVVARWQGSASDAAHERIRFLGARTDVGADALSGLPKVLADYAQALREAQARYAAGQLAAGVAAMGAASATSAIAAVEAETTTGVVPGNDPGHVGRQRQAGAALDAAVEAGQAAAADMAGAVAAEKVANDVAAGQVQAITGLMAGMAAARAAGPSPAAADWADGYRAPAPQQRAGDAGGGQWFFDRVQAAAMAEVGLPDPNVDRGPDGQPLENLSVAERAAMNADDAKNNARLLDISHIALDTAGTFPKQYGIAFDAANTVIYALQRDWANAAISARAIVPKEGSAETTTRAAVTAARLYQGFEDDADLAAAQAADPSGRIWRSAQSGTRGDFNAELQNPLPNAHYVVNGHLGFDTDGLSRTVAAAGTLALTPNGELYRDSAAQRAAGGQDRRPNAGDPVKTPDDGGHNIATSLSGPGERINLGPMDRGLNRGVTGADSYRSLETRWERELRAGNEVYVDIKPVYAGDSQRAEEYVVNWRINGVKQDEITFDNERPTPRAGR